MVLVSPFDDSTLKSVKIPVTIIKRFQSKVRKFTFVFTMHMVRGLSSVTHNMGTGGSWNVMNYLLN